MNSFLLALVSLAAVANAYELVSGVPTNPPIAWTYQVESFVTYLAVEQEGYPADRQDLTTTAALTCMSNRIVALLPGVSFDDIFWSTTKTTTTEGIWDHQQTVFYQFDVNFVPQNIIFSGLPNYQYRYNKVGDNNDKINWEITDPSRADDGVNKGYVGVYEQNVNCRDCFPDTDVVYLRFKDLIAKDVTSGSFLDALGGSDDDTCSTLFENTNYAYVSFSESAAVTEGSRPARPHHNLHLEYVWFLMFLLVPASIYLYNRAYKNQAGSYYLSNYDADRETEMAAATQEPVEENV